MDDGQHSSGPAGNLAGGLGHQEDVDGQAAFLERQHTVLLRAAYLLSGDSAAAQDLAQETVVRVLLAWRKVERADVPEAYVQRVLMNTFLAGQRRRWRGERPFAQVPQGPTVPSPYAGVEDFDALRRALLALPPRQRAAVVLRHYEDLSEARTAEVLGCSVGTVKSLTSRGLAALRTSMIGEARP